MLKRGCVASNEHFAKLLGVRKASVSRSISSLESKGYIKTEITGGSRNHERKIFVNNLLFKELFDNKMLLEQPSLITNCIETKGNNTSFNNTVVKSKPKPKTKRFTKPTAQQINAYLKKTNNDNLIDAEAFIDYYQAKDWMIGSNRMKDWQAAVRTWLRRDNKTTNRTGDTKPAMRAEMIERISKGRDGKHAWRSEKARKLMGELVKRQRIPWTGNSFEVNAALSEVL